MKKTLSKNFLFNTTYQVLMMVIPLFTMPYLSRILGAEGIGLYSFNNSIASYFVLFAILGSAAYGQREIAYRQDSRKEYSRTFWEVFAVRAFFSAISLALYALYVIFLGRDKTALLILALSIINVTLDISWLYVGIEEFSHLSLRNIFVKSFYIAFIFFFIKTKEDVYLYVLAEVGFTALQSVMLWFGIRKFIDGPSDLHPFRHVRNIVLMFLPSLAIQLYTVLDKTMLGMFSDGSYSENGFYEQAQNIVRLSLILVTSLVTVMSPKISYFFANKEFGKMREHLYFSYRYVWFITIILFVEIFFLCPIFVPLFLGDGFMKTIPLIQICCPMFLIIGLSNVTGLQYFVPCNYIKQHTISLITGAIVNIILNSLLIPKFSSVGASVASVIAELAVTTTQFAFVMRIGDMKLRYIFNTIGKYLLAGIITSPVLMMLVSRMAHSWSTLFILIIFELVFYVLVLLLLRDKMVLDYAKSLFAKLRAKEKA